MGPATVWADRFFLPRALKLALWAVQILFVLLFHGGEQSGQVLGQISQAPSCLRKKGCRQQARRRSLALCNNRTNEMSVRGTENPGNEPHSALLGQDKRHGSVFIGTASGRERILTS